MSLNLKKKDLGSYGWNTFNHKFIQDEPRLCLHSKTTLLLKERKWKRNEKRKTKLTQINFPDKKVLKCPSIKTQLIFRRLQSRLIGLQENNLSWLKDELIKS